MPPREKNRRLPSLRERRRQREAEPARSSHDAAGGSGASLVETLDRVLSRGVVAQAEVVLSVAEIPLVYVGLQALVASVEVARELKEDADARV